MASYFKKFAYNNTERLDFEKSLEAAAGTSLSNFSNEWLRNSGVNTIQASFASDAKLITNFEVIQTGPTLREHRTIVALFRIDTKGGLIPIQSLPALYKGERTSVPSAIGLTFPDLVYANSEDHDYVKVQLDKTSLGTTKRVLSHISDPFLKSMLWQSL